MMIRYIGYSYMTFYGPSGRKYRFGRHGQELPVDPRDRDFVRNLPNVREVPTEKGD
jgi:hypothetical protein